MKKIIVLFASITFYLYSSAQSNDMLLFDLGQHEGSLSIPLLFGNASHGISPVKKKIRVSTGVTLEYVEQGNTNGTAVLFLHGFPDSWKSFEQVMQYLPGNLHVLSFSQRGFGGSSKPLSGYKISELAADVAAFVDALHLGQVIVAGHSMGSTVLQRFVLDYPEKVKAVVMMGAVSTFTDKKDLQDLGVWIANTQSDPDIDFVTDFQQGTIARPVSKPFFDSLIAESMKLPLVAWKGILKDMFATDYIQEMNKINKPALIVWGTEDKIALLKDQIAIQKAIRGSKFISYEGAGHSFHWEDPETFAHDLINFIKLINK